MLLECVVLLCQRRGIREELRKRKVYNVVKNLDLKEEDEAVSTLIYDIVNFLMGDEDHATPIDAYDASKIVATAAAPASAIDAPTVAVAAAPVPEAAASASDAQD